MHTISFVLHVPQPYSTYKLYATQSMATHNRHADDDDDDSDGDPQWVRRGRWQSSPAVMIANTIWPC